MPLRLKIAAGLALLSICAAAYGLRLYYKHPPDIRAQAPDVTIKAADLVQAFKNDEAAAGKQFIDKILVVNGKTSHIQVDATGLATVSLETGDPLSGVVCSFYPGEASSTGKLKPGDEVSVKGKCTGMLTDVILNKCSLIK